MEDKKIFKNDFLPLQALPSKLNERNEDCSTWKKKFKKNTHVKVRYKKYGMGNPNNGENFKYFKLYIRLFKLTLS